MRSRARTKHMRKIILLVLIAIFTGTLVASEPAFVPFRLQRGFLIVFDCSISPFEKLACALDTGASRTVVDEQVANRLHLEETADEVFVAGRSVRVSRIRLEQIVFSTITVRSLPVLVVDLDAMSKALGVDIEVVVGVDVWSQHAVTIDYRKRVLRFHDVPSTESAVALDPDSPYPLLPVMIGGQMIRLLLDTGGDAISLFEGHVPMTLQRVSLIDASGSSAAGALRASAMRNVDIQIGEVKFARQTIFLVPGEAGFTAYDGHFGVRALNASWFHFDFAARQIGWGK
jgi:hypothetical protein